MKKREIKIKNRFISFYNKLSISSGFKNAWVTYIIFIISSIVLFSIVTYYLSDVINKSTSNSEKNIYIIIQTAAVVACLWTIYFSVITIILVKNLTGEKQCRIYFEAYTKYRKFIFLDFKTYEYDVLFADEIENAKRNPSKHNKLYL